MTDSRIYPTKQGRDQLLHGDVHGIKPCDMELSKARSGVGRC